MAYRLDIRHLADGHAFAFQGLLDREAIADVRARIAAVRGPVRLVLLAGTDVDPTCLAALRTIGAASVVASSPFLTRLLSEDPR